MGNDMITTVSKEKKSMHVLNKYQAIAI
jgi:hypothetical protein